MQEARPRRLGERTVDYGLAAMDFCEALRAESRELLLMIGKSINTSSARKQGKTIGA